ncbi:oxidoreductase [Caldiplasma sukawensis]
MKLFEPFEIEGVELKNRIAMAPMISNLANPDGSPSEAQISYLEERSKGCFGLLFTEYSFVNGVNARGSRNQMGFHNRDYIPKLRRLTERVHMHGAKIFAQLVHAGGKAMSDGRVAPSAVDYMGRIPRELSEADINGIIEDFAFAAGTAYLSNFDGVEIHGAHGYLVQEFYSPSLNKREDDYGIKNESGTKLAHEILKRIREEFRFPVGIRISLYEDDPDGYDENYGKEIVNRLKGFSFVHVSAGRNAPPGSSASFYWPKMHIGRKIKDRFQIPTILVGSINDMQTAEEALEICDVVALGRAALADPYIPEKWRRKMPYIPCIRCNQACRDLSYGEVRCTVNPFTGFEKYMNIRGGSGKVVIAGAGISGLYASIFLSDLGFKVEIHDINDKIGGVLNSIIDVYKRQEFHRLLEYFSSEIKRRGIRFIGNSRLSVDECDIMLTGNDPYPDLKKGDEIFVDSNIYKHQDQALALAENSKVFMTERSLSSLDRDRASSYRKIGEKKGIVFVKERDHRFSESFIVNGQYDIFQAAKKGISEAMKFAQFNH